MKIDGERRDEGEGESIQIWTKLTETFLELLIFLVLSDNIVIGGRVRAEGRWTQI